MPPSVTGAWGSGLLLLGSCLGPSEDKALDPQHRQGRAKKCVLQGPCAPPRASLPVSQLRGWHGGGAGHQPVWLGGVRRLGHPIRPPVRGQLGTCRGSSRLRFPICAGTSGLQGASQDPGPPSPVGGAPRRPAGGEAGEGKRGRRSAAQLAWPPAVVGRHLGALGSHRCVDIGLLPPASRHVCVWCWENIC